MRSTVYGTAVTAVQQVVSITQAFPVLKNALQAAAHPYPSRSKVSMASRKIRQTLPSSIIPTLESYSDLSTLFSYVNSSTKLYNLLNSTENFTFLAPTNDAIAQWISTQGNSTPSADVIEATLSYHILNGSWPSVDFKDEPQFVATSLSNASYSNVTIFPGGQRVELVNGPGGDPEIVSNNKTATTISHKVCTWTSLRILMLNFQ